MRRCAALVLIAITIATLDGMTVALAASRVIPTAHAGELAVQVGNKTSSYHLATTGQPAEVTVTGPINLRVLSRVVFGSPPGPDPVPYAIRVFLDGSEYRVVNEVAVVSSKARRENGDGMGTLERALIPVPGGQHTLRIGPVSEGRTLALRFFTVKPKPKKARANWIGYAPETYEEAVRLHVGDTETIYYRFNTHQTVGVELRGPLRLKVRSRLDFATETGYTQSYVVKVLLDGKIWKSFPLETRASHTGTYPDLPEITPGVARDFTFTLPDGDHTVTFQLDCTTAARATLRILVPEKEIVAG